MHFLFTGAIFFAGATIRRFKTWSNDLFFKTKNCTQFEFFATYLAVVALATAQSPCHCSAQLPSNKRFQRRGSIRSSDKGQYHKF